MDNMGKDTGNLGATAEFSKNLAGVTEQGEDAIKDSAAAIKKVREASQCIAAIVQTINDIAKNRAGTVIREQLQRQCDVCLVCE